MISVRIIFDKYSHPLRFTEVTSNRGHFFLCHRHCRDGQGPSQLSFLQKIGIMVPKKNARQGKEKYCFYLNYWYRIGCDLEYFSQIGLEKSGKVVFLQPQFQHGEVGEWLKPTVC